MVIYTSHQRMDPVDEACAVEIAALIQSGKSVEADDVLALCANTSERTPRRRRLRPSLRRNFETVAPIRMSVKWG